MVSSAAAARSAQALLDAQGERGVARGRLDSDHAFASRHRLHAGRHEGHRCEGRGVTKHLPSPGLLWIRIPAQATCSDCLLSMSKIVRNQVAPHRRLLPKGSPRCRWGFRAAAQAAQRDPQLLPPHPHRRAPERRLPQPPGLHPARPCSAWTGSLRDFRPESSTDGSALYDMLHALSPAPAAETPSRSSRGTARRPPTPCCARHAAAGWPDAACTWKARRSTSAWWASIPPASARRALALGGGGVGYYP